MCEFGVVRRTVSHDFDLIIRQIELVLQFAGVALGPTPRAGDIEHEV
jgi:hypothetical protein